MEQATQSNSTQPGPTGQTNPSSGKRRVNWILTLVMSVLFGGLGVDRFIMGHVGLGILKLLTAGGCGIWYIIDIILIAIKHPFEDIEWVEQL
jgi:TM2 domain-containing membrane protein YozV